jgi:hypothetical protein
MTLGWLARVVVEARDHLEFGRLRDWQIGSLFALTDESICMNAPAQPLAVERNSRRHSD